MDENMPDVTNVIKPKFQKAEYLAAVLLLLAGKCYVGIVQYADSSLPRRYVFLEFVGLYVLAGILSISMKKEKMSKESSWALAFLLAFSGLFLTDGLYEDLFFLLLAVGLIHLIAIYWMLSLGTSRRVAGLGEESVLEILRGLLALPLSNFYRLTSMAASCLRRLWPRKEGLSDAQREKRTHIYTGIFASAPVLVIVLPLLAHADESFALFLAYAFAYLRSFIASFFSPKILWNLLAFLTGSYLFGLFYGSFYEKPLKEVKIKALPQTGMMTFIGIICGVYLLFFAVKLQASAAILLGMERDIIYSSFAREGFFELCFIAVLNLALFYGVRLYSNREERKVKLALTVLSVETLCFILLAFSKMSLYISVYGFTFKRVMTSWFMMVLFFLFSMLLRNVWRQKNPIRWSVIFALVTFLLLAYSAPAWWMELANAAAQL